MSLSSIERPRAESGLASLLLLAVVTPLLGLAVVLFAFGSALGVEGQASAGGGSGERIRLVSPTDNMLRLKTCQST
jgi:hypothetical protein